MVFERGASRPSGEDFAAAPAGDRTRDPDVAALERFAALADDMRAARAPSGAASSRVADRTARWRFIVPPLGLLNPKSLAELGFAAVWSAFTGAWTFGAARGPAPAFALFSLPFWGVGAHLGKVTACAAPRRRDSCSSRPSLRCRRDRDGVRSSADADEDEEDDGGRFFVAWEALGRTIGVASGALRDVTGAEVVTSRTSTACRKPRWSSARGSIARRRPGITQSRTGVRGAIGEDALAEAGYRRYNERRGRDGSFARSRL